MIRRLNISQKGSVQKLIAGLEGGHDKLVGAHSCAIMFNGKVVQLITGLPALLHEDGTLEEQDMNESCCRQTLERLRTFQEYVDWIDGGCVEVRPVTTRVRALIDAVYGNRESEIIEKRNSSRAAEHAETYRLAQQKLLSIANEMLDAVSV